MGLLSCIKSIFNSANNRNSFKDSMNQPCKPDNKERNLFCNALQNFFDAGVLREIYYDNMISICNVSNSCYAIFDYVICKEMGIPCGFVLEACYLHNVMHNNVCFYKWIAQIPENERDQHVICCGEKTFAAMIKRKQQTDLKGPLVNLEYEQKLIDKYGDNLKTQHFV